MEIPRGRGVSKAQYPEGWGVQATTPSVEGVCRILLEQHIVVGIMPYFNQVLISKVCNV